jgi:hypothetical protein
VDERDQKPVAAEQRPLVRFLLEHPLVRDKELERESERSLRRVERIAGQRMRRPGEVRFELRPQRVGRVPVALRELEPARFAHRDDVRRGQRVADQPSRLDRVALQRRVEPREDLCRAGFWRMRRVGIDRRKAERQ